VQERLARTSTRLREMLRGLDTVTPLETIHQIMADLRTVQADMQSAGRQIQIHDMIASFLVRLQEMMVPAERRMTIPGTFPEPRSEIRKCEDKLVEMGYFTEEHRDLARSLSEVVEGNLNEAMDVMAQANS
jgi:hypothetical protein